jgi:signal transduction histidine kinase
LLLRVLYNMAINAFEATESGGPVRGAFSWRGRRPCFSIHNPGVIPEVVRARIFHRTFSTKAVQGRGLGTHAMKLFGENLLKGEVGFDTSANAGTTFRITLPPELEAV